MFVTFLVVILLHCCLLFKFCYSNAVLLLLFLVHFCIIMCLFLLHQCSIFVVMSVTSMQYCLLLFLCINALFFSCINAVLFVVFVASMQYYMLQFRFHQCIII